MDQILWHRRESRRKRRKQTWSCSHGRLLSTRKGIAHIRFSCAIIRLQRGDLEKGELQTIFEELAESFSIFLKMQLHDRVAVAGNLLGQILASVGHPDEALRVLDHSAAAFKKLQMPRQVENVHNLRDQIRGRKNDD